MVPSFHTVFGIVIPKLTSCTSLAFHLQGVPKRLLGRACAKESAILLINAHACFWIRIENSINRTTLTNIFICIPEGLFCLTHWLFAFLTQFIKYLTILTCRRSAWLANAQNTVPYGIHLAFFAAGSLVVPNGKLFIASFTDSFYWIPKRFIGIAHSKLST